MVRNGIESVTLFYADDGYLMVKVVYFSGRSRVWEFADLPHYLPVSCVDSVSLSVRSFIDSSLVSGSFSETVLSDEYWITFV